MSRKLTVTLAALLAVGSLAIATGSQAKPIFIPKPVPMKPMFPVKQVKFFPVKPIKPAFYNPYWKHHGYHPHWKSPVIVVAPSAPVYRPLPVAMPVSQPMPVASKAPCLSKTYTPDGWIIFKDVCANETAATTIPGSPAEAAQKAAMLPQANDQANGEAIPGPQAQAK